jgi:hypothetical protein
MSFHQPLSYPQEANERRHDRHVAGLAARVQELGRPASAARAHDVSISGCRLGGAQLAVGAEIWVAIGVAAPRRARVVWLRGSEAGCAFYAPLTRAELRNVMLGRRY